MFDIKFKDLKRIIVINDKKKKKEKIFRLSFVPKVNNLVEDNSTYEIYNVIFLR